MARVIPRTKQPINQFMRTVLADYASGYDLKDISIKHYVTYKAVLRATEKAKDRLGARHLAQAVILAHSMGYITLPDENGRCFPSSPWEEDIEL